MRNVRNFWVDLEVDGKKERIGTGPRSKDGGFHLTVKMRDEGDPVKVLTVWGHVLDDGSLKLEVFREMSPTSSDSIITISTKR